MLSTNLPFYTSDLIAKIRDYQSRNQELMRNSHHFVFDCPFGLASDAKPKYIWMGLNPGDDTNDWSVTENKNSEETRDYDFQRAIVRSSGSARRMTKLRSFLGDEVFNLTTHTQLFFWCSKNIKEDFYNRYQTSFQLSPHIAFCCNLNRALIDRIEPRAIFLESRKNIKIFKNYFKLDFVRSYPILNSPVDIYMLEDKFKLINFDHLSALGNSIKARPEVSSLVRGLLEF